MDRGDVDLADGEDKDRGRGSEEKRRRAVKRGEIIGLRGVEAGDATVITWGAGGGAGLEVVSEGELCVEVESMTGEVGGIGSVVRRSSMRPLVTSVAYIS